MIVEIVVDFLVDWRIICFKSLKRLILFVFVMKCDRNFVGELIIGLNWFNGDRNMCLLWDSFGFVINGL